MRVHWIFATAALLACASGATAQTDTTARGAPAEVRRLTVTWTDAPIRDVLLAFAAFSGKSIVPGANVTGLVTAKINDQPWDEALRVILETRGLVAVEDMSGILLAERAEDLHVREGVQPLITRAYRLSYAKATELQATLAPLLSERGSISVLVSTNQLIVSDIARVHATLARLLGGSRLPQPGPTGAP